MKKLNILKYIRNGSSGPTKWIQVKRACPYKQFL